jgi:hypothetical protein
MFCLYNIFEKTVRIQVEGGETEVGSWTFNFLRFSTKKENAFHKQPTELAQLSLYFQTRNQ